MRRYVVSLPPTIVTTPLGACRTAWLRETSAVPPVRVADQRSQARERAHDVVPAQRDLERRSDHVEQEADVALRRLGDVRRRAVDRLVGQADVDPAVRLGQREHEARLLARHGDRQRRAEPAERRRAQDDVRAPRRPQREVGHDRVGPHAGRVDDRLRADPQVPVVERVVDVGAVAVDLLGPAARQHATLRSRPPFARPRRRAARRPRAGRPTTAGRRAARPSAAAGRRRASRPGTGVAVAAASAGRCARTAAARRLRTGRRPRRSPSRASRTGSAAAPSAAGGPGAAPCAPSGSRARRRSRARSRTRGWPGSAARRARASSSSARSRTRGRGRRSRRRTARGRRHRGRHRRP